VKVFKINLFVMPLATITDNSHIETSWIAITTQNKSRRITPNISMLYFGGYQHSDSFLSLAYNNELNYKSHEVFTNRKINKLGYTSSATKYLGKHE